MGLDRLIQNGRLRAASGVVVAPGSLVRQCLKQMGGMGHHRCVAKRVPRSAGRYCCRFVGKA
jgi:hypothetical protein